MKIGWGILATWCLLAHAGDYGQFGAIFGQPQRVHAIGNNRLTAGVTAAGRLVECRWPSASSPNQLVASPQAPTALHAGWALATSTRVQWLSMDEKNETTIEPGFVRTTFAGAQAAQIAFVYPEKDLLIIQLALDNTAPETAAVWYADFSLCTESVPQIPSFELFIPSRRDLIAFSAGDVAYQVRPRDVGRKQWEESETWVAGGAEPAWLKRGDAHWLATASLDNGARAMSGRAHGDTSIRSIVESDGWSAGPEKSVGDCASAISISVETNRTATVAIAFGERRTDVDEALEFAREKGFEALADETRAWWERRLAHASQPPMQDDMKALYRRALTQLLTNAEKDTGAIVRAPISSPPFAVDIPRLGVWTSLALDLADYPLEAERHIEFYLKSLRQSGRPGAPPGSVPAALFGTGIEAAPSTVLDLDASSWLLWSAWQHDPFVPESERARFREDSWRSVEPVADFVADRCRMIHNTPVLSFDPERLSDTATLETIALASVGIRSALSLAQVLGHEKPDWQTRRVELEDYLRFHALDVDRQFKIESALTLWPTEIVAPGDPRWRPIVDSALARIPTLGPAEALHTLANLTMLLRDQADPVNRIGPLVVPTIQRALDQYPADAYYAALAVTVILTTHSHGAF